MIHNAESLTLRTRDSIAPLLLHPEAVFHLRVFQRCLLRGRQLCTACSHGNGSRGINELRGDLEILHAKWVPSARQQWPQSIW